MGRLAPPNRIRALGPSRVYETVKTRLSIPRKDVLRQSNARRKKEEEDAQDTTSGRAVPPVWLKVLEKYPPSAIMTRPQPTPHRDQDPRRRVVPKNIFKPQRISFPEDELRRTFFRDHPWELARPRIAVELDGKDSQLVDWATGINQPGMQVTGESVIQRQMHLMEKGNPEYAHNQATGELDLVGYNPLTKEEAYDVARKELYLVRQAEDIRRRVTQEEARHVGGYFGKSRLQVSMELEDKAYDDWREWAEREARKIQADKEGAYANFGSEDPLKDVASLMAEEDVLAPPQALPRPGSAGQD